MTFLFTDVEGSTALWESDPAMAAALARHDEILRLSIEEAGGYVFTTAGDSFAAAFAAAPDAAQAAVAAQQGLEAASWETADPLRVRMAVHTGTAEQRDGDYFGTALNRAARLLAVGHGGQVLLSQAAAALIEDQAIDLGEHRLKDLTDAERVFQLGGTTASFPALRSLDARPNNLPVQLTSFIGREEELEEVAGLIRDHRLLTLTGVGGSGKTRLALQAGGEVIDAFSDGVWFIEFAAVTDPDLLPRTVLDAMRISMGGSTMARDRLESHLSNRRLLLLFDNCEHLLDEIAALTDWLLRAAPQIHVLTTSREGLAIGGERLWRVPSLQAEAEDSDAVRLFVERAAQVNPGFLVTDDNASDVLAICERLDGMPLAIELAAAQTRVLPVDVLIERLDDRFRLLTGGSRTAVERHRTLQATVEWSYDLLSDQERLLFDRLAAFRGGFTLDAAEAVASGDGLEERDLLELLAHLVDKSLVVADSGRFRMLETLRQFSMDQLAGRGEADDVRRRHADRFLALAEEAEPLLETPAQVEWTKRLIIEHDNLRAALRWLIDSGSSADALRMTAALSLWFWYLRRDYEEAMAWHEETLALIDDSVPTGLVAINYAKAAVQASRGGYPDRGDELAVEAIRVAELSGNARAEIAARWALGHSAFQGRYDRSVGCSHFEEALRLAEAADDSAWEVRAEVWITLCLLEAERLAEAMETINRAYDVARNIGWTFGIGNVASQAAWIALRQADYDLAGVSAAQAVEVSRNLDDPYDLVDAYIYLAQAARLSGDPRQGREVIAEALALVSRRTDRVQLAKLHAEGSAAALAVDDVDAAGEAIGEALELTVGHPFRYSEGVVLAGAAAVMLARADAESGVTLLAAAERCFAESFQPESYQLVESERYVADARDRLGVEAFNDAWRKGAALDLDEAPTVALSFLQPSPV